MARHRHSLDKHWWNVRGEELNPERNISLESAVAAADNGIGGGGHRGYAARMFGILPAPVRYAAVSLGLAAAVLAGSFGGLACKPQPEPGSYWKTVTPVPFEEQLLAQLDQRWAGIVRQQPWYQDGLNSDETNFVNDLARSSWKDELPQEALKVIMTSHVNNLWRADNRFVKIVVKQPWFLDGLSKAELYFAQNWFGQFDSNPLLPQKDPAVIAAAEKEVVDFPNKYVSGSVKTMQGELEVIITFEPEKTSREHAEHVRDIYIATIPVLEQYLNQPFPELIKNRGGVHAVFINDEGNLGSSPYSIQTIANKDLNAMVHEHAQNATDFGPYLWNEGTPWYVGLKALAIAIEQNPQLAVLAEEFGSVAKPLTPANIMNKNYEYFKGRLSKAKSNGVPIINLKAADFDNYNDYKVNLQYQTEWVYVFMKDLETAVGEDAFRDGILSLVQRYAEDATGRSIGNHITDTHEQVYKAMQEGVRQYAPDKLPAFDKLWEERVFGPERFALMK